jgi:hypothetical protein
MIELRLCDSFGRARYGSERPCARLMLATGALGIDGCGCLPWPAPLSAIMKCFSFGSQRRVVVQRARINLLYRGRHLRLLNSEC